MSFFELLIVLEYTVGKQWKSTKREKLNIFRPNFSLGGLMNDLRS